MTKSPPAATFLLLGLASLVASQASLCACEKTTTVCEPIIDDGDGTCSDGTSFGCDRWGCTNGGTFTCEIVSVTYLHYTDRPNCEVSPTEVVRPIGETVFISNLDAAATDVVGSSNIDTIQFKGFSFTNAGQIFTINDVELLLGQFDGGDLPTGPNPNQGLEMGVFDFTSGTVDWTAPIIDFDVSLVSPSPDNGPGTIYAFPAGNAQLAPGGPYIMALRMNTTGSITWLARETPPTSNDVRLTADGYFFFNSSAVEWQTSTLQNQLSINGQMNQVAA